jgi:hypothetical protein
MAITAIGRYFTGDPNIVGIVCDNTLAEITTAGYLTGAAIAAEVVALNNGEFDWEVTDQVLISYAPNALVNWFRHDATNNTFTANPAAGGLSNSLPSGDIFVGNGANIATGVAMSNDATMANTGALTIANGAVTGAKMANNTVDFAQIALDVAATATVSLTAAQVNGMYAAPVQLIAAPGAGKLILIDSILWDIAFVSASYAAGGAIQAQYGNTVHGAGPQASASIAAATLNAVAADSFLANGSGALTLAAAESGSENTAVFLSNATGAFTTGDSTVTLYIRYRILTPV